ncbi:MAG: carbohydrate-binding domain-containing protein [Prevotella sp.]|nr:carbohydrate-binding domain-containing protein [Prevotella sp.]
MRKNVLYILLAGMAMAGIVACENDDTDFSNYTIGTGENEIEEELSDTLWMNIVYSGATVTVGGDVSDSVTIVASGADVTVTSTLNRYLEVTLSGTTTDGSLLVNSQKRYGLVLNGVNITNGDGPAINNQCSKALYLTLADGTTNMLTDGTAYADAPTTAEGIAIDQKGTLFSEGQIYFRGTGTLTVNGNARNGIASDDYIVVEDGNITINVAATGTNGLKVNDGLEIQGGTLVIGVAADGARGIKNDARTTISGGTTTIATSGDCLIETLSDGTRDTTSCAGIRCDSLFTMTAGTLNITSSGDGGKGINCNEDVVFSGGTLTVVTTGNNSVGKPKGVKSDTGITVSGGSFSVTVRKSWACDNGSDSDDPADMLTVVGTPTRKSIAKRQVTIVY